MNIPILFEDDHLLVVRKPEGLLSVPGRTPELRDCVWNRLREGFEDREVRLVHRLDRDTSGLMVFAFTAEAQKRLGQLFERRKVRKEYVALAEGRLEPDEGLVRAPIRKDWTRNDPPVYMVCGERGKPAITRFQVEERRGRFSRVRLFPVTGRSHQLRVHLRHLGHPILGDPIYGDGEGEMRLCAVALAFPHPVTGDEIKFRLPDPAWYRIPD
jgi:tRNA pseudouridine32 synthase/23S rRNA pseudouridine746 synthase